MSSHTTNNPASRGHVKAIETCFAAFEGKLRKLEEESTDLKVEEQELQAEETQLTLAKRKLAIKRHNIEARKAMEEMKLFENILDKAVSSMIRIAGCEDGDLRQQLLRSVEKRVRDALGEVERALEPLSTSGDTSARQQRSSVPQKRTSVRAGFADRRAYAESEDEED